MWRRSGGEQSTECLLAQKARVSCHHRMPFPPSREVSNVELSLRAGLKDGFTRSLVARVETAFADDTEMVLQNRILAADASTAVCSTCPPRVLLLRGPAPTPLCGAFLSVNSCSFFPSARSRDNSLYVSVTRL